ncbi:MAG TPA: M48 family metalloprotease [Alphaproteobacteria bacterium]|nr:M48 family metalloprotease [Alphaproteobacteria bacterium]
MNRTIPVPAHRKRFGRGLSLRIAAVLLTCLPVLAACATNPATGERMVSFISSEEEGRIGAQEHKKIVPAMGGAVENPELQTYVSSVGRLLARTSELPNLKFTFTVLDTDMVNAFALPGGYIYITRGLLALANSEAELAGVLAHEIGHVTARHAAQRHTRSIFAGIGAAAVGILTGSGELAQATAGGLGAYLKGYSREQEFEADKLGIRYLRRAGFDTGAMARFLASLRAHSRLTARLAGQSPDKVDETSFTSTHPRTLDRVRRAAAEAGGTPPPNPILGRDIYLQKITGIIYGDSPDQGFVRGRDFRHPVMRFRFRVPQGFRIVNRPSQVIATGPNDALMLFHGASRAGSRAPLDYLRNVWAKGVRLQQAERLTINGLAAATAAVRIRTQQGTLPLRTVAIRRGKNMFQFLFLQPGAGDDALLDLARRTAQTFEDVSEREAASWRPYRIRLQRVIPGDTVNHLARRMAVDRLKVEHFRVINALGPKDRLESGRLVKIIEERR